MSGSLSDLIVIGDVVVIEFDVYRFDLTNEDLIFFIFDLKSTQITNHESESKSTPG